MRRSHEREWIADRCEDALTPITRCYMNDAHKRAFLAAKAKEWGGA